MAKKEVSLDAEGTEQAAGQAYNPNRVGSSTEQSYGTSDTPIGALSVGLGDRHSSAAPSFSWSDWFRRNVDTFKNRQNPYSNINAEQARMEQMRVIQDLQRQAAGDLNSLAQQQLRAGYGQAQAQQSSLGSTMRGQGAGAAMRGIQQGQQSIERGYAGDQQMLQLQEQQAAQAMLAQMLAQQQQQDIAQAQGVAQGTLGAQSLDDAMRQFYAQSGIQTDVAASQLAQERARAQLGFDLESQNISNDLNRRLMAMGATGAGQLASTQWGSGGNRYRQVDGVDSIVPEWDK